MVDLITGGCRAKAHWWRRLDAVAGEVNGIGGGLQEQKYLFGRAVLTVSCEDVSFSRRFRDIFSECTYASGEPEEVPRLLLRIRFVPSNPEVLAVSVVPSLIDGVQFVRQLFPERQYVECRGLPKGWRTLALPNAPDEPVLAFGPSTILASCSHPWQHTVAIYTIANAFRLQPDVLVFHAASIAIAGRGVLLFGDKGAGKTTLSLCLASRGNAFLGDEWGAILTSTRKLLPMRSLLSIRQGPRAAEVDAYLRDYPCRTDVLPDGTKRVRARAEEIFPRSSAQSVPLTHAFFLRRFAPRPALERFARERAELLRVSPLLATIRGQSPGQMAIELLRTLGKACLWHLDVGGSPDETAELIERTVREDIWD